MLTWVSRPRASWARHNSAIRSGCPMARYTAPSTASRPIRQRIAAPAENDLAGVAVADSRLDPSGREALRRNHIQEREPGMVDGAGGLDELLGPGYRLKGLDPAPSNPAQVAMVAATSRSPWSAAHRNAVRRLANSTVNQS